MHTIKFDYQTKFVTLINIKLSCLSNLLSLNKITKMQMESSMLTFQITTREMFYLFLFHSVQASLCLYRAHSSCKLNNNPFHANHMKIVYHGRTNKFLI